jgi:5-methyltetrahydrofolate--homocysteine methyltransferase
MTAASTESQVDTVEFRELLRGDRPILLDGGMGTMLQSQGVELGKVPECLNITHPEVVQKVHKMYIDAGSDIINTCSFGVNEHKIQGCGYTVEELIQAAVANAKAAEEGTDT